MNATLVGQPFSSAAIIREVLTNRWLRGLLILAIGMEIYNVALPAVIGTEKARESRSAGYFADVTRRAEAELLQQRAAIERETAANSELFRRSEARAKTAEAEVAKFKALSAAEVAANSDRKQRADARKATALARKSEAEAETARQISINAELHKSAEAEASTAQVALSREQLAVEEEVAAWSGRLKKAEADKAELDAAAAKATNLVLAGTRSSCLSCYIRFKPQ